uniref:hypothetical protein 12 n=1 Tax=Moniliophthora perniciosa TaxID=153609 RepID=UPI0000242345|nr:hypothetical protein 12 [Moniliophthora perniciosa]AAQ74302.1 hypothetical protein 12 [Moniliophthora perniciosa]
MYIFSLSLILSYLILSYLNRPSLAFLLFLPLLRFPSLPSLALPCPASPPLCLLLLPSPPCGAREEGGAKQGKACKEEEAEKERGAFLPSVAVKIRAREGKQFFSACG